MAAFDQQVRELKQAEGDLLLTKHRDYGPDNIARAPGGPINGLAVRLHDKVARLSHLLDTGADPEHEALVDTAIDIANYGTILSLVISGDWPGTSLDPVAEPGIIGPAAFHWKNQPPDTPGFLSPAAFGALSRFQDGGQLSLDELAEPLVDEWAHWDPLPHIEALLEPELEPAYGQQILVSTAGVVGVDRGRRHEGHPVLEQPMQRYPGDLAWHQAPGSAPSSGWTTDSTSPYRPNIEVGDRVQIGPWSDPDKAGLQGRVSRYVPRTDGPGTVTVVTDCDRHLLLTAYEALVIPGGGYRFRRGDHVRFTQESGYYAGLTWAVTDGVPDEDGELPLSRAFYDHRAADRGHTFAAPDVLELTERSLSGPFPVRATRHGMEPEKVVVLRPYDDQTVRIFEVEYENGDRGTATPNQLTID